MVEIEREFSAVNKNFTIICNRSDHHNIFEINSFFVAGFETCTILLFGRNT